MLRDTAKALNDLGFPDALKAYCLGQSVEVKSPHTNDVWVVADVGNAAWHRPEEYQWRVQVRVDPDDIWMLLWSVKQRCFHIETLADFTESSRDMVLGDGEVTDYLPLCSGPSHHAMQMAASDDLRACLEKAADSKSPTK